MTSTLPVTNVSLGDPSLRQTLRQAARETGVSFDYLLQTAQRESSLNPNLRAKTSSAAGLFQFIEQTWLATIRTDGERFGLKAEAAQVERGPDGQYFVRDPKVREAILDLRRDPEVSSRLAGALTQRNESYLERTLGRPATAGDLYIAHFLGAEGGSSLIRAAVRAPQQSAAELFPQAAQANPAIFFKNGSVPRTVSEVRDVLTSRHQAVELTQAPQPVPDRTLASHSAEAVRPSRILASGPEVTFLASHFGEETSAFVGITDQNSGAFAGVLGQQASFFAPQKTQNVGPLNSSSSTDVIPSRYGRSDPPVRQASLPTNEEIVRRPLEPAVPRPATTPPSGHTEEVIVYPSVFNQQKTVVVTSSEFGKTDLPLDLSHYLKRF